MNYNLITEKELDLDLRFVNLINVVFTVCAIPLTKIHCLFMLTTFHDFFSVVFSCIYRYNGQNFMAVTS